MIVRSHKINKSRSLLSLFLVISRPGCEKVPFHTQHTMQKKHVTSTEMACGLISPATVTSNKRIKGYDMVQFLIKRFIGLIFVVIVVTFITFVMGYLAPGDPIRTLLGEHFNPTLYAALRHQYHLDLPWYQQ